MSDPYADIAKPADPYAAIAKPARQGKPIKGAGGEVFGGAMNLYKSIPLMDEGAALFGAAGDLAARHELPTAPNFFAAWKRARETQDVNAEDFAQRRPLATAGLKTAGTAASLAVPAGRAGALLEGGRALSAARGATQAAGTAYLYGVTDKGSLKERAQAGADAAADPVTVGLGAGVGALAARGAPKPGRKPTPTLPQMQKARSDAYAAVDNSGFRYSNEDMAGMLEAAKAKLAKGRFDPDFQQPTAVMVKKIEDKVKGGYSPTLSELDDLRKFVGENLIDGANKNQRRLGRMITGSIDEAIETAGGEGSDLIRNARDLHGKVRKTETVMAAMDRAKRSVGKTGAGNISGAIRQQMDRVLTTTPNLKPEEEAALRAIVEGDKAENMFRQVGKLSPSGNGLSLWFNLGHVVKTGGLSAPIPIAGVASKMASDHIIKAKVKDLLRVIAEGTPAEVQAAQQELSGATGVAADALRRAAAARLETLVGASRGGGQLVPATSSQ